jgi:hypothetical protein
MVVLNALTAVLYLFFSAFILGTLPQTPSWALPVLGVGALLNVACAVALFQWKKWGFYGFVVTSIAAFTVNLMIGLNPLQAIFGLLGLAILYGVLQIGGEKKGWTQLE